MTLNHLGGKVIPFLPICLRLQLKAQRREFSLNMSIGDDVQWWMATHTTPPTFQEVKKSSVGWEKSKMKRWDVFGPDR